MADERNPADRGTSIFTARLAHHPHVVVAFTLGVAVIITLVLVLTSPGASVLELVGTLATVWGLDLALVIYLVTARDTDLLLGRIDALQDQLSAALADPGTGAEVLRPDDDGRHETDEKTLAPSVTEHPAPQSAIPDRRVGPPAKWFIDHIPADYLTAIEQQAGVAPSDILRAWTPNPGRGAPWVIEVRDGRRWSVFSRGGGHPTVIPLDILDEMRRHRRSTWQDRGRRQRQRDHSAHLTRSTPTD